MHWRHTHQGTEGRGCLLCCHLWVSCLQCSFGQEREHLIWSRNACVSAWGKAVCLWVHSSPRFNSLSAFRLSRSLQLLVTVPVPYIWLSMKYSIRGTEEKKLWKNIFYFFSFQRHSEFAHTLSQSTLTWCSALFLSINLKLANVVQVIDPYANLATPLARVRRHILLERASAFEPNHWRPILWFLKSGKLSANTDFSISKYWRSL